MSKGIYLAPAEATALNWILLFVFVFGAVCGSCGTMVLR